MAESTSAGSKIYVGTTASAAETDSYVQIKGVTSIGGHGRTYQEITFDPVDDRGTHKHKGSYNDGNMELSMGDDTSDPGQIALAAALDTDFDYNFKVVQNDAVPAVSGPVTVTIAAPGVVTDTAHGFENGTAIKLATTGALPTGLVAGTTYYIVNKTDDTYQLAATKGGSAITTTGTQSGTHTRTTVPAPTTRYFKAKVMAFPVAEQNSGTVQMRNCTLGIKSGSLETIRRNPGA